MIPGQYMFGVPIFDAPLVFSGDSAIASNHTTFSSMGHNALVLNSMPLFISGFDGGTVSRKLKMFIRGTPVWSACMNTLPMVIDGIDQGMTSSSMNLIINGGYPAVAGSIPLFIENDANAKASTLRLFIKGDGLTPGFIPSHSFMSLYIERGPTGGITLYIENKEQGNSIPLFIEGHPTLSGQSPLFIEGFGGTLTRTMSLVIPQVSIATSINRSLTLAIPKVVGVPTRSVPLHIVGWHP